MLEWVQHAVVLTEKVHIYIERGQGSVAHIHIAPADFYKISM